MKNIKYIFIFMLTLSLVACKDSYLDVNPIDRYSYYTFLETEAQVEQAVTGCYRKVAEVATGQLWIYGDMLSDNTSYSYNPTDRGGANLENVDEFIATSDNPEFNNLFSNSYEGIQRTNFILEKIDGIKFFNPNTKILKEAEARFTRAWHYFNLVRVYGEVPIILKTVIEPDFQIAQKYPRRPVAEVYSTMIEPDVKFALENLPETVPVAEVGRLTKGAAIMLLAHVLVTQKKFAEANTELAKLKGYSLQAEYKNIFDPTRKNTSESIFEIQYNPLLNVTTNVMNSWTPWGTGTTIYGGNSNTRGGLNQPTKSLNDAYVAADKRKPVVIGSIATTAARGGTLLFMNKYNYWDATAKLNPVNWIVYRYADAILLQAECQNEIGYPSATALTLLNSIRLRAGLPPRTLVELKTKEEFAQAIQDERRLELAGESHRWFDLVRTGKAVEVMTAHGIIEKAQKATISALSSRPTAYTKISLLAPYPRRERETYGYPQTPGW
jgi:starch-binding outer membrane protein, SusD/RagB family